MDTKFGRIVLMPAFIPFPGGTEGIRSRGKAFLMKSEFS
jgi:hypothetical protein